MTREDIMDYRPSDSNRILRSIRGKVSEHGPSCKGSWLTNWWTKTMESPSVRVQLDQRQLGRLEHATKDDSAIPPQSFVILLDDYYQQDVLPVGAEVEITFGYASQLDCGFGAEHLKIMNIKVVRR